MLADTSTIDEKHARLGKNGACSMLLCGGVGMQAGQQEVHPGEGEDDKDEGDDGQPGHALALPFEAKALVQVNSIENPGNECPGLLGVPTPPAAPCLLRPDGPGENDHGEQQKAQADDPVAQVIHLLHSRVIGGFPLLQLNQISHTQACRDGEGGVGEGRLADVQREPGGA